METIAVYGSLKKGLHNHRVMGNTKYIGETTVEGTMYDVGGYPVLMETKGERPEDEFKAEIYQLLDKNAYNNVYMMETRSGYIEKEINTQFGNAKIYYGDPEYFNKTRLEKLNKVTQWPPEQSNP